MSSTYVNVIPWTGGYELVDSLPMAPVKKPKPNLGTHFLRKWRDHRGIGQQAAADAINVSRELLSKIEGMKSPYLQPQLEGLAALYECSVADLLTTDQTNVASSPETRLRSALLSFGLDADDLGGAVGMIRGFLAGRDEPQPQILDDDQSAPASHRRG